MTVFATSSARHGRMATTLLLTLVMTIGIGIGAVLARADQRLDEADGALEKAAALLEASQAGVVSPATQRKFDRHLARALANIARARAHVAAAIAVVDEEIQD